MNILDQIKNPTVEIHHSPRTYVKCLYVGDGESDAKEVSYERIVVQNIREHYVYYVNSYNRSMVVYKTDHFFSTLEEIYELGLKSNVVHRPYEPDLLTLKCNQNESR